MRRLRPSLVISTCRTFGGNATGCGNRTAWLRLVVNTVERVTLRFQLSFVGYPTGIYLRDRAFVNGASSAQHVCARPRRPWYPPRASGGPSGARCSVSGVRAVSADGRRLAPSTRLTCHLEPRQSDGW